MQIRRRYIALLAVLIPAVVGGVFSYIYPSIYDWLAGYMVLVALAFKSALLSFVAVSKLKLITFIKSLTIVQGISMLIKRWFLDNVFARWLERNIFKPMSKGFSELTRYYKALNFKAKLKNILLPIVLIGLLFWGIYETGYLNNILLFTELKVFVIGVSKTALAIIIKVTGFMLDSWITPILEVFAMSWLLNWLERIFGENNPLIRLFNNIGERINRAIFWIAKLNRRHLDPIINKPISQKSTALGNRLEDYVKKKKISYEYLQFDKLQKQILNAHIDAYHSFKGMEKIKDKKELYRLINKKTADNIDIVAFVSRNSKGELLPQSMDDSFYNDIFILEGIASSHKHGIKEELESDPDHSDFWVLNTSIYPATLHSHSGHINPQNIPPQSLTLIKNDKSIDYEIGDIYFKFKGRTERAIPIV